MQRFYDIKRVEQQPLPSAPPTPRLPVDYGAGVPNSYTGNDYRNRMPFHFVDEAKSEDFYGWQYGQTMELVITFGGEPALEEQPYVTDVLRTIETIEGSTKSVVDKETKIANLEVGTMAFADASLYPKKVYVSARLTELMIRLSGVRNDAVKALRLLEQMQSEIDKGDEMNSKLIEELQRQIVDVKETLNKRIDDIEQLFGKELEGLDKKVSERFADLEGKVSLSHDMCPIEKTWKLAKKDWMKSGEGYKTEKQLPIDDVSDYDIAVIFAKEEPQDDGSTVYSTSHSFTWGIKDKNVLLVYSQEQKPLGSLSVYMTKKSS